MTEISPEVLDLFNELLTNHSPYEIHFNAPVTIINNFASSGESSSDKELFHDDSSNNDSNGETEPQVDTEALIRAILDEHSTTPARASSEVKVSLNLDQRSIELEGAGEIITFPNIFSPNNLNSANDLIVPFNMASGDALIVNTNYDKSTFTYGGIGNSNDVSLGIFGATHIAQPFDDTLTSIADGQYFTISSSTLNFSDVTFTFNRSNPDTLSGELNSLDTLAQAMNAVEGLSARISNNFLYYGPTDANQSLVFKDNLGSITAQIGLTNIEHAKAGLNNFNSLSNLADQIQYSHNKIGATMTTPAADASLKVFNKDPYGTICYSQHIQNLEHDLLAELGLTQNDASNNNNTATTFGPTYDPHGDLAPNMASNIITPTFNRPVEIFDSFGGGHYLYLGFLKTNINQWALEIFSKDFHEIDNGRSDGLVAAGEVNFNGDGSLQNIDSALSSPISLKYTNNTEPMTVNFNWGNAGPVVGTEDAQFYGDRSGLGQLAFDNIVNYIEQNGAPAASIHATALNNNGDLVIQYKNGIINTHELT